MRLCPVCRAHFNQPLHPLAHSAPSMIFSNLMFHLMLQGRNEFLQKYPSVSRVSPSRIVTLRAASRCPSGQILMVSGIFSAVRIWSERAVTTLLRLTLAAGAAAADTLTGCEWHRIGDTAEMKNWRSSSANPFLAAP